MIIYFLTSCTASYFLYSLFYYLSPLIWSLNPIALPINEYMPWIRWAILEHDGIEVYALYLLMFLNLGFACLLNKVFLKISKKYLLFLFLLPVPVLFFKTIGFYPPLATPAKHFSELIFVGIVLLITSLLILLNDKKILVSTFIIALLLPICLFSSVGMSKENYIFVLSPAVRLLHGFGFNESYFQYDYLLSILAALWMKLHLSIWTFPIVGRLSFWILLSGIYLFAKKYFHNSTLAIYLVISLTVVKVYGNTYLPDFVIQITPLRLDLWLPLLALTYWKGTRHWMVGAALGFLIIFHRTFGYIYCASYITFIFILLVTELIDKKTSLKDGIKTCFSLYRINIILILTVFLFCKIFLESHLNPGITYLKNCFGFLPVTRQSFYWYVPPLISLCFLLLWKNKPLLSEKFFKTGIFLITLAIGNSVYFFGRSHENNIINIASSLFLALFLLFDLLHLEFKRSSSIIKNKLLLPFLTTTLLSAISYFYSARAVDVSRVQWSNFKNKHLVFHNKPYFTSATLSALKNITHLSSNVIFLSQEDFFYYNETHYNLPNNYNCFMKSWFLLKDYTDFLNKQLDDNFYIVVPKEEFTANLDILHRLHPKYGAELNNFIILSNTPLLNSNFKEFFLTTPSFYVKKQA